VTWFGWVYVVFLAVNAALAVLSIGEERKPMTSGVAVTVVILDGLLVWGAVTVGTTT
jgi:hypothetical protein